MLRIVYLLSSFFPPSTRVYRRVNTFETLRSLKAHDVETLGSGEDNADDKGGQCLGNAC